MLVYPVTVRYCWLCWCIGHCALKCVSLLQIPHLITFPSEPIGLRRLPRPFPVLRRKPFPPPRLPRPLKYISSKSASVISVMNWKRRLPLPRAFPFPVGCRFITLLADLVGFRRCFLHLCFALLYAHQRCSSTCAAVIPWNSASL